MTPAIAAVALYAGLLTLVNGWLSFIIGGWRRRTGIVVGDGGNLDLVRAMRGQANFVETVPLALILFLVMAMAGAPAVAIHVLGALLVLSRVLHGMHFSGPDKPLWQRQAGAGLSALVLILGGLGAIGHALAAM